MADILVSLRFGGGRFERQEQPGLDLEVLQELVTYRKLVIAFAKALWFRDHPKRKRLPRQFEDDCRLRLVSIQRGSTVAHIEQCESPSGQLGLPGLYLNSVAAVAETFDAAIRGESVPPAILPHSTFPHFKEFGSTLQSTEFVEFAAPAAPFRPVQFVPGVKQHILDWFSPLYEDNIELTGEVLGVQKDLRTFRFLLQSGAKVEGSYPPEFEEAILSTLIPTSPVVRIRGSAEFHTDSGRLLRIIRLEELRELPTDPGADRPEPPIWETLVSLGASVGAREWKSVPRDLSSNLDHYLYGSRKQS